MTVNISFSKPKILVMPPFEHQLPAPAWFRVAIMPADATYPVHSHPWREFVYSFSGVMEVKMKREHLTAPSHYGVWLPPEVVHEGLNRYAATHCSLYLMPELCAGLPTEACTLEINGLIRSILEHLHHNPLTLPPQPEDFTLLQVLRDQLKRAPRTKNFLPYSDDPLLKKVMEQIEHNLGSTLSLAQLANQFGTTIRTLNRKSQLALGMPINEWRQRLRIVRAMQLLEKGEKVESIAFEMGYSSASAFIAMFHRLTGRTPAQAVSG